MKYCIHCGCEMEDQDLFCANCGNVSENTGAHSHKKYDLPPEPPTRSISVGRFYREMCVSKMGTFFTVISCLLLFANLIMAFFPIQSMGLDISQVEGSLNVDLFSRVLTISLLVSLIPSVLIVIGVLITVFSARKSEQLQNARGIRLITGLMKVMRIVYPVLLTLCAFAIVGACSHLSEAYGQVRFPQIGGPTGDIGTQENVITFLRLTLGLSVLILWGGCVFNIIFYNKLIRTLASIATSIEQNRPSADISMFVVVMCFIAGGASVPSLVGVPFIIVVVNGLNAAMQILAGFMLLSIRKNASIKGNKQRLVPLQTRPGSWQCGCGCINDPSVNTCSCGYVRPEVKSLPDPAAKWICTNCQHANFSETMVCRMCGASRVIVQGTQSEQVGESWLCLCGKSNPHYVSTCSCGRSKY